MSMMMRDPSDMFMPLRQAMDRLMDGSFLWPGRFDLFSGQSFPIDLSESNDHQQYIVEATVPGFKPEEIQITAQGGQLTIHAAKKQEQQQEKGGYVRRERYEGEMTRMVTLPGAIDESKVEATYENGVLTVRIPKAAGSQPRQIPVKTMDTSGTH
jgi:HSP20 family protein